MENKEQEKKDYVGTGCIISGGAAAGSLIAAGVACPLCIIGVACAAPALVGYGIYRKIKGGKYGKEKKGTKNN